MQEKRISSVPFETRRKNLRVQINMLLERAAKLTEPTKGNLSHSLLVVQKHLNEAGDSEKRLEEAHRMFEAVKRNYDDSVKPQFPGPLEPGAAKE